MRFLIGGRLPGKLDILLDALAVDLVDAFLTGRSHVVEPGFSESQGREVKMEWTPSDQKAWRQCPSFIYTHTHSCLQVHGPCLSCSTSGQGVARPDPKLQCCLPGYVGFPWTAAMGDTHLSSTIDTQLTRYRCERGCRNTCTGLMDASVVASVGRAYLGS